MATQLPRRDRVNAPNRRIPANLSSQDINPVAPPRDPGLQVNPQSFGFNIGQSLQVAGNDVSVVASRLAAIEESQRKARVDRQILSIEDNLEDQFSRMALEAKTNKKIGEDGYIEFAKENMGAAVSDAIVGFEGNEEDRNRLLKSIQKIKTKHAISISSDHLVARTAKQRESVERRIPELKASIDWKRMDVKDAISAVGAFMGQFSSGLEVADSITITEGLERRILRDRYDDLFLNQNWSELDRFLADPATRDHFEETEEGEAELDKMKEDVLEAKFKPRQTFKRGDIVPTEDGGFEFAHPGMEKTFNTMVEFLEKALPEGQKLTDQQRLAIAAGLAEDVSPGMGSKILTPGSVLQSPVGELARGRPTADMLRLLGSKNLGDSSSLDERGEVKPQATNSIKDIVATGLGGSMDKAGNILGVPPDLAKFIPKIISDAEELVKAGGISPGQAAFKAIENNDSILPKGIDWGAMADAALRDVGLAVSGELPNDSAEAIKMVDQEIREFDAKVQSGQIDLGDSTGPYSAFMNAWNVTGGTVLDAIGLDTVNEDVERARFQLALLARDFLRLTMLNSKFAIREQEMMSQVFPGPKVFENPQLLKARLREFSNRVNGEVSYLDRAIRDPRTDPSKKKDMLSELSALVSIRNRLGTFDIEGAARTPVRLRTADDVFNADPIRLQDTLRELGAAGIDALPRDVQDALVKVTQGQGLDVRTTPVQPDANIGLESDPGKKKAQNPISDEERPQIDLPSFERQPAEEFQRKAIPNKSLPRKRIEAIGGLSDEDLLKSIEQGQRIGGDPETLKALEFELRENRPHLTPVEPAQIEEPEAEAPTDFELAQTEASPDNFDLGEVVTGVLDAITAPVEGGQDLGSVLGDIVNSEPFQAAAREISDGNMSLQDVAARIIGQFSPQSESPTDSLPEITETQVGVTAEGRPVMLNVDGSVSSERQVSVEVDEINDGKVTNIPTMFGGKQVSVDEAIGKIIEAGGKDPETGRKLPSFNSIEEADKAAIERSASLRPVETEKEKTLFEKARSNEEFLPKQKVPEKKTATKPKRFTDAEAVKKMTDKDFQSFISESRADQRSDEVNKVVSSRIKGKLKGGDRILKKVGVILDEFEPSDTPLTVTKGDADGLLQVGNGITKKAFDAVNGEKLTGKSLKRGVKFTKEEVGKLTSAYLEVVRKDVAELKALAAKAGWAFTENEEAAIISLVWNMGVGGLKRSPETNKEREAFKAIKKGDRERFKKEAFDSEIGFVKGKDKKGNRVTMGGLVRRRKAEAKLFDEK